MEKCQYCGYGGGGHDDGCPAPMPGVEKEQAHRDWDDGYRKGRSGGENPADSNPSYSLGYSAGVVALEEAQNGEPFFSAADLEDLDKRLDDLDDPDTIRRTTSS